MHLTAEPMPDDSTPQAFRYGPIVLSGDFGSQGLTEELIRHQQCPETRKAPMDVPSLRAEGKLENWIKPAGSAPLTFRIAGSNPPITFRPLNVINCCGDGLRLTGVFHDCSGHLYSVNTPLT